MADKITKDNLIITLSGVDTSKLYIRIDKLLEDGKTETLYELPKKKEIKSTINNENTKKVQKKIPKKSKENVNNYEGLSSLTITAKNKDIIGFKNIPNETLNIPDIIDIKGTKYVITAIDNFAFSNCTNLTQVILPESIELIGMGAFSNCLNLKEVYIPKNIKSIGTQILANCPNASLNIDKNNKSFYYENGFLLNKRKNKIYAYLKNDEIITIPSHITTINFGSFKNCTSLHEIYLPNSIKAIEDDAFMGCSNLKKIELLEGILHIGKSAFRDCISLEEIYLPNSVERIEELAFSCCEKLKKIHLPENLIKLNSDLFNSCLSLTTITLPNTIETIEESCFLNCQKLKSVKLSTSLKTIGKGAFSSCKMLNVTIPNSVTKIGIDAFKYVQQISIKETKIKGYPWGAKTII